MEPYFSASEFDFHPRLTMACDSVYITRKQFVLVLYEVCLQPNSSTTKCRLSLFNCLLWSPHQCRLRDEQGRSSLYEYRRTPGSFTKLEIITWISSARYCAFQLPILAINDIKIKSYDYVYVIDLEIYCIVYILLHVKRTWPSRCLHLIQTPSFWSDSKVPSKYCEVTPD